MANAIVNKFLFPIFALDTNKLLTLIPSDMPYRRLPNTDAARIRAMKEALEKGRDLPPFKLAYSSRLFVKLQAFLPQFEHFYKLQRESMNNQIKSNRAYQEIMKKARLYLSHFLRVMSMAIQRGDIRRNSLGYYGLPDNNSQFPQFNTEKELLHWGEKIIEGEAKRIIAGRTPVSNPTIAVVKVHFEKFKDALQFQKTLHKKTTAYSEKVAAMRKEADAIILEIWNEVENTFSNLEDHDKREQAMAYGLVYVYRKGELEKIKEATHISRGNIA